MNRTLKYFNLYLLMVAMFVALVSCVNAQSQLPAKDKQQGAKPAAVENPTGKDSAAGSATAKEGAGGKPTVKEGAGGNPTVKEGAATKATEAAREPKVIGQQIKYADGSTGEADEVFKMNGELWVRRGSVTERLTRSVKSVETIREPEKRAEKSAEGAAGTTVVADNANPPAPDSFWVLLKGGARMKVDEVTQNEEGAWCRRGNFSVLISADRIEGI